MLGKGLFGTLGLAAVVALTLAGSGSEAHARRRCCCNSYGYSNNGYYNNGYATSGNMQTAAPAPAQTYDGSVAPVPDAYNNAQSTYQNGQPYGAQYGPRGTVIEGGVGVPGAIQGNVPAGSARAGTRANVNAPAPAAGVQGNAGANGNARAKTGTGANLNAPAPRTGVTPPAAGTNARGSTGANLNGAGTRTDAQADTKVTPPAPEAPTNPTDK